MTGKRKKMGYKDVKVVKSVDFTILEFNLCFWLNKDVKMSNKVQISLNQNNNINYYAG